MNDLARGTVAGIGGGVKAHLTSIYTKGEKTFIRESYCGSVKTSGWNKSRTYGAGITGEQGFELVEAPGYPRVGSENYEELRLAYRAAMEFNAKAHKAAKLSVADEFLALSNACSKCVKHLIEIQK